MTAAAGCAAQEIACATGHPVKTVKTVFENHLDGIAARAEAVCEAFGSAMAPDPAKRWLSCLAPDLDAKTQ